MEITGNCLKCKEKVLLTELSRSKISYCRICDSERFKIQPLKGVKVNPDLTKGVILEDSQKRSLVAVGPKQKCTHCGVLFQEKHECSPEMALKRKYQAFVSGAKGKGVECNITFDMYKSLKDAWGCYYCGITKRQYKEIMEVLYETSDRPTVFHISIIKNYHPTWHIDRLDPMGIYVEYNVVPACAFCNVVKGRLLDVDQMLLLKESMRGKLLGLISEN